MSRVLDLWAGMTGTVLDFAGVTAPDGWLMCYGQAVSRTTYKNLFDQIGTTFGAGDGSTTFNVPDLRGRICVGKDNMGGTAANRMTSAGGVTGTTLGAVGGAETHTLTTAQVPAHTHPVFLSDPGHNHATTPATFRGLGSGTSNGFTSGPYGEYAVAINNNTTGITVRDTAGGGGTANQTAANAGGGSAHANVQPSMVMNKIICC
jgi:microcystin-dependent protein